MPAVSSSIHWLENNTLLAPTSGPYHPITTNMMPSIATCTVKQWTHILKLAVTSQGGRQSHHVSQVEQQLVGAYVAVTLKLEQLLLVCFNEPSGGRPVQEHRVTQHILHEGDVGLDTTDLMQQQHKAPYCRRGKSAVTAIRLLWLAARGGGSSCSQNQCSVEAGRS